MEETKFEVMMKHVIAEQVNMPVCRVEESVLPFILLSDEAGTPPSPLPLLPTKMKQSIWVV